jgi:hypothetical protein
VAQDIAAEVQAWVADEIDRQRMGKEYGFAVAWGAAQVQAEQGSRVLPVWTLLLTARSPLIGDGPLYHGPVPVGAVRPAEDEVRRHVGEGLRMLRDLAASKLAARNGHGAELARR